MPVVLIVDDSPIDRTIVDRLLRSNEECKINDTVRQVIDVARTAARHKELTERFLNEPLDS